MRSARSGSPHAQLAERCLSSLHARAVSDLRSLENLCFQFTAVKENWRKESPPVLSRPSCAGGVSPISLFTLCSVSVAFRQFFAFLRLFRFGIAEQLSKIERQTAPHFESEFGLDACGRARMYALLHPSIVRLFDWYCAFGGNDSQG